jgi:CubicO group peptidase (beta-lactamase class C family)
LRYTAKDQLTDLFKIKPLAPGTKFQYSNAAFFLQGAIIEQVTGQPYDKFIQENILDKAGMSETTFINGDSIVPNRAQGYTKRKGQWVRFSLEQVMQSLDANGFSSLISTTDNLDKFCHALSEGKIITTRSFSDMAQPVKLNNGTDAASASNRSQIAMGWFIKTINGRTCISHSGHTGTMLAYFPAERLTIVLLTNLGGGYGGIAGDKGFKVADAGFQLAEMAAIRFLTKK